MVYVKYAAKVTFTCFFFTFWQRFVWAKQKFLPLSYNSQPSFYLKKIKNWLCGLHIFLLWTEFHTSPMTNSAWKVHPPPYYHLAAQCTPRPHTQCWHFPVLTCGRSKLSPTLIILHEFSTTRGWRRGNLGSHTQLFYFGVSSNLPFLSFLPPAPPRHPRPPACLCLCLEGPGKLLKVKAALPSLEDSPPCCCKETNDPSHPSQLTRSPKSPFYGRICSENLFAWLLAPDQVIFKTRCPGEGSMQVWKEGNLVKFKQTCAKGLRTGAWDSKSKDSKKPSLRANFIEIRNHSLLYSQSTA